MTVLRLTQRRMDSIKPRTRQFTIRDTHLRGFGVRVLSSGAKRYFGHSQHAGRSIWTDMGDAATVALADAPAAGPFRRSDRGPRRGFHVPPIRIHSQWRRPRPRHGIRGVPWRLRRQVRSLRHLCAHLPGDGSVRQRRIRGARLQRLAAGEHLPILTGDALTGTIQCAVQRCTTSVGANPTRQMSFQPVAIGTAVEETNRSKLLV